MEEMSVYEARDYSVFISKGINVERKSPGVFIVSNELKRFYYWPKSKKWRVEGKFKVYHSRGPEQVADILNRTQEESKEIMKINELYRQIREIIKIDNRKAKYLSHLEIIEIVKIISENNYLSGFYNIQELLPSLDLWKEQKTVSTHPSKENLEAILEALKSKQEEQKEIDLIRVIKTLGNDRPLSEAIKEIELKDKVVTIKFK